MAIYDCISAETSSISFSFPQFSNSSVIFLICCSINPAGAAAAFESVLKILVLHVVNAALRYSDMSSILE